MRKLLSYAKSHIYDIHAVVAATIVVVLMYFIKKPLKQWTARYVDGVMERKPELMPMRSLYLKRCNMLVILVTMILAFVVFTIVSLLSPMIHFSFQTGIMSGVYALCEYAIIDQITYGYKK